MIMIRYFYIIHYHPRYPISALIVLLLIISSIEAQSGDELLVTDTTSTPKKLTSINDSVITSSETSSHSSSQQNKYDIINEKSNQSVSRPSNILKQLWSSASQSYNNSSDDELIKIVISDDNNRNTTASNGSGSAGRGGSVSKKLISAPIKWSSEIVPSVPLQLQLPSKAIFLPHFLTNEEIRKSSPNGDITVINGNDNEEATAVTYQQRNFADQYRPQWLRQQQQQESGVSKSLAPLMASELIANSTQNCTQPVTTENEFASIDDQILKINNLTYNAFVTSVTSSGVIENPTEPDITSKISNESVITTSEPFMTRRTAALEFTTTAIKKSTEYSLPRSTQTLEERRRAAINSKFGIRLTPPRSSVDTILSIFKPSHLAYNSEWNGSKARKWPNIFPRTTKSPQHHHHQQQLKAHKSSNDHSIKPKVSVKNKFINRANSVNKQTKDLLPMASEMRVESRPFFANTPQIFPSRQTPNLRPKIVVTATTPTNNKIYYRNYGNQPTVNNLKENWANILKSRREMFLNNINSNKFEKRSEDTTTMNAKTTELNIDKEMFNDSKLTNNDNNQNMVAYTEISTQPIVINPEISDYQDIDTESDMSVLHNRNIPVYYEEYSVPGHVVIPEPELYSHETDENHQQNADHLHISSDIYLPVEHVTPDPNILPNPDLFKHELSKPKTAPKFSLRPIDPQYFQKLKDSKDPATLPNKMQAMQELISALGSVKKSITKLNPIGKHMASMYKSFVSRVKAGIKSKKGPYANYYPPGDFDEEYDGEDVEHRSSASEINATFVRPPHDYNSTFGANFTDADADDYVKKSFGYRVTIYKSPDSLNPNITEELITDDDADAGDDNDYEELESDASDESPVTDTKSKYFTKQAHDKDIMGEKHGKMKGSGKILDHNKNKLEKDRASKAREHKSALKLHKVDTHKRKHSNERALKERTTIEFFEREQISDTHKHHDNERFGGKDIQALGTESNNSLKIPHPNGGASERYIIKDHENQTNDHNNSDSNYGSESSNKQLLSIKFPNAKTAHKDDAHKYKGWRERGYKIITETEFVDRGNKLDTGFKKQEKGNLAHTKEHNAKDLTRGEKAKYYKNVKELNKSFDTQYGNRDKQNDFKGYDKEEELPQHSPLQSSPRDKYAKISIISHDVNKNTAPYGYRLSSITSEQYPYPHTETETHLKDNTESNSYDTEVPADSTSYRLPPAVPTASSDSTYSIEPTADNALSLKATSAYEPTYHSLAMDPNPTSSSSDVSPESIISREPELSSNYFRNEEEEEYDSTPISNSNKDNNYYNSDDTYHEENDHKKSANSGNNNNSDDNNDESDAHLDNSSSSGDQIEPAITYHKQIDHSSYKTTSSSSSSSTDDPKNNDNNHNETLSYSLSNPNQLNDASNYENIDNKPPVEEEGEDNSRHYYNDYNQKANSNNYETYPTNSYNNNNENYYFNNPKNNINPDTKYYSLSQYLNDQNPQFFNNTAKNNDNNNSDKKPTEYIIKPSYFYRNHYNDSYGTTATTALANNNNNNEYSTQKQYEPTVGHQLSNDMQITTNPFYDYATLFSKNNYDFPNAEYFNQQTVPTMTSAKEKTVSPFIESPFVYNSNDIENIHNIYNEAIHLQDAPDLSPHGFTSLPTTTTAKAKNLNTKYLNAAAVTSANGINVDLGSLGSKRQNSDINIINNKKTRIKLRYKNNNGFAPNYRLTPASPLTIPPLITANENLYLASNMPQHFLHTAYSAPQAVHYDIRIPFPMTAAQQMPTTTTRIPLFVQTNAPTFLYGHQALPFSASDARPVAVLHRNKFVSITTPAMLKTRAHHHLSSNMWTNIDPLFQKLSPFRWRLNGISNPINSYGFSKKHSAIVPTPKTIIDLSLPKIIKEKLVKSSSNANGNNKNEDKKSIFKKLFSFR